MNEITTAQEAIEAAAALCDKEATKNREASDRSAKRERFAGMGGYEPPIMADELMACAHECEGLAAMIRALSTRIQPAPEASEPAPIDMILYCPRCHERHVDAPDERTPDWTNPPHRSHLCHGCGFIWRPADVPTNGVAAIKTVGKSDMKLPPKQPEASEDVERMHWKLRKTVIGYDGQTLEDALTDGFALDPSDDSSGSLYAACDALAISALRANQPSDHEARLEAALREQTSLVGRLLTIYESSEQDIGHEPLRPLLGLLGPAYDDARAALAHAGDGE